jgi:hypothetical protein
MLLTLFAGACEVVTHEVSPGVFLSMQALPTGGHELRRVRFAKQMFSSDDAEQWWAANRSAVYANYNIVGLPHQQQQQPGLVALSGHTQQQQQGVGGVAPLLSSAGAVTVTSNGGGSVDEQQQQQQQQQGVVGGRVSAAIAALTGSSSAGGSSPPPVVSVMNPHPLGPAAAAVTSRAGSLSEVRTKR